MLLLPTGAQYGAQLIYNGISWGVTTALSPTVHASTSICMGILSTIGVSIENGSVSQNIEQSQYYLKDRMTAFPPNLREDVKIVYTNQASTLWTLSIGDNLQIGPAAVLVDPKIYSIETEGTSLLIRREAIHIKNNDALKNRFAQIFVRAIAFILVPDQIEAPYSLFFYYAMVVSFSIAARILIDQTSEKRCDAEAFETASDEELRGFVRLFSAKGMANHQLPILPLSLRSDGSSYFDYAQRPYAIRIAEAKAILVKRGSPFTVNEERCQETGELSIRLRKHAEATHQ